MGVRVFVVANADAGVVPALHGHEASLGQLAEPALHAREADALALSADQHPAHTARGQE